MDSDANRYSSGNRPLALHTERYSLESCIRPHPVSSPLCKHRYGIVHSSSSCPLASLSAPPVHLHTSPPTPSTGCPPSSSNPRQPFIFQHAGVEGEEGREANRVAPSLPPYAVNPFTSVSELCVFSPFLWNHAPPLACHTAAPPPPSTGGPLRGEPSTPPPADTSRPPPPPVLWIRKGRVDPSGATLLSHVRQ